MKFPAGCFFIASLCFICAGRAAPAVPEPRDWTWVQGAVFVPTNAVNEAQQWDEYDPAINDRELRNASVYGINVVRVYLHYYVYLKKKDALLANIEDFLTRADKYKIKTELIFFDDCWNQPPEELLRADYRYPAPLQGVHNSQWLVSPGEVVRQHYDQHKSRLKSYVQDIVNAHKADPRIVFWEIYNEPNQSPETIRLGKDAYGWIKETGSVIPVTATGREYSGGQYSDFYSWHEYDGSYKISGDAHALCTECMNRQGQTVPGIVEHYKGRTGFIMWEFGIGRDNCRFSWDEKREKPRATEATTPFHGVVYPDGHPWALADAQALLGPDGFARAHFFNVNYYKDEGFGILAKSSVTPFIDFDLGDETGTGSPDASAGVPKDHFSVRYSGTVLAPASGSYTFTADCDNQVEVIVFGQPVVTKKTPGRSVATGAIKLEAGRTYSIEVRYVHATGDSSLHLNWSGPGLASTAVEPSSHYIAQ